MNKLLDRMSISAWVLLASGAGMVFILGANAAATAEGGGPGIRAAYAILLFFFVVSFGVNFRPPLSVLIEEKWILILWLWAFASTAWSPLPGMTLRRCIALLGTTLAGLILATRFEPKEQLRIVAHCIGLAAVASLVAVQFFPDYAIAPMGEWTGVFEQKNGLGHTMGLGVFCYTFLALAQGRGRVVSIIMAIFCASMLVMSQSVGAMVICATMLMLLPFRKLLVLQAHKLIVLAGALLALGIPVGIYVMENMDSILKSLGREATLTGRVPLWQEVLDEIAKHPWRGFGYSAFWFSSEGTRVQLTLGWPMIHSHDGYLEVTLGLGLIGLALLGIILIKNIFRGIRVAREGKTIENFWPLFYLIFAVLANLTECWFLTANSLLWMLFVANSYWLVRRLQPVTVEEDDTEPTQEFALGSPMGIGPAES